MVQQFVTSLRYYWKLNDRYLILLLIFLSLLFFWLYSTKHLTDVAAVNQLLNNLIQFSGIFSAIIITYLIQKVFSIREERLHRQSEIIKLSNKLTDFRRIARVLVNNRGFWDTGMRSKMDHKYKILDSFIIRNLDLPESEEIKNLKDEYFEDKLPGANMYLAMKTLVLQHYDNWQLELYDKYDYDYTYSLRILEQWKECLCANMLWYCLDYKKHAYNGCFNFFSLWRDDQDEILHLAIKINSPKYNGRTFDQQLLADLGSDFDSFYLPKLVELTYYNSTGLSPTLNFISSILILTILSGVLIPILLTSITIEFTYLLIAAFFATSILSISLFYFLFKLRRILTSEIRMSS